MRRRLGNLAANSPDPSHKANCFALQGAALRSFKPLGGKKKKKAELDWAALRGLDGCTAGVAERVHPALAACAEPT